MSYLDIFHTKWYESLLAFLFSFPEPKDRLLGLFEFRIYYQEKYSFPGCPFNRINTELGANNEVMNIKLRNGKTYFKGFILDLVKNTPHKRLLTDEDLADLIFLLIEGGLSSAAIYQSSADLARGKRLLGTLL